MAQLVRNGDASLAQSKLILTEFMDLSTLSAISIKVYTDAPVGTLLKLKTESTDKGFANERDVNTTMSGAWQTYTWDFAGDLPMYNVLTFMLGYATPNDASPSATFLFDDIAQVDPALSVDDQSLNANDILSYPNPAKDVFTINAKDKTITMVTLFDILGNQVKVLYPNSSEVTMDMSSISIRYGYLKNSNPFWNRKRQGNSPIENLKES